VRSDLRQLEGERSKVITIPAGRGGLTPDVRREGRSVCGLENSRVRKKVITESMLVKAHAENRGVNVSWEKGK